MSTYRLKNLLSPRSVALVGASPRKGSFGQAIRQNIHKAKFEGDRQPTGRFGSDGVDKVGDQ
jgi:acetyltransferase